MRKTHFAITFAALLGLAISPAAGAGEETAAPELVIRCDDIGMCHSVNMAIKKLLTTGLPFSTSLMVPCPWFLEAAEIVRDQPQVSVGLHLVLNSEWQHYKWGPILGAESVPSLVDESGHFHTSTADFRNADIDLDDVRRELRAQIDYALAKGVEVDYFDYHMLTAISTPELSAIVEELAREYGVGLSRFFDERSASLWDVDPEQKLSRLLQVVDEVRPGRPNLVVMHLGVDSPELRALVDLNNPADPYRVAEHRAAELEALTSPAFRQAIAARGIELVTYRQLIDRLGLASMKRPSDSGYSMGEDEEEN